MSSSSTSTAKQRESAGALVDLAINGGLLSHVDRDLYTAGAEHDPRGFVQLLEKKPPAPPLDVQVQQAARQIVGESGGRTSFVAACLEVGKRWPSLMAAYAREHHGRGRTS